MDKQTKQRLIIGGTIIATLIILFLLLKKKSVISTVLDEQPYNPLTNINMPGMAPISWDGFPPLVYSPPSLSGLDLGIDYIPSNPNGSLGLTNNMPVENGNGKACEAPTQPPLVLYSGGGSFATFLNSSGTTPPPQYLPFAWGR